MRKIGVMKTYKNKSTIWNIPYSYDNDLASKTKPRKVKTTTGTKHKSLDVVMKIIFWKKHTF